MTPNAPIPREDSTTCSRCGQPFPPDELISVSGISVCANCKPTVVQEIREGVAPEVIAGGEAIGFGIILSEAWAIYSKNFVKIALLVALTSLPISLLDSLFFPVSEIYTWQEIGRSIRLTTSLETFFGIFSTLCVVILVARQRGNESTDVGSILGSAVKRWPAGIFTGLLSNVIIIVALVLLIVPGVMLWVYYAFVIPAVALCGRNGTGALRSSWNLVRGRWWQVFGFGLGFFGISIVPMIVVGIATEFATEESFLAMEVAAGVFDSICLSFFTVGFTVYFLRLLGRAES